MLCWRKKRPERGFMITKSKYRGGYRSNCNSIWTSYAAVYKSLCRLRPANLMNKVTNTIIRTNPILRIEAYNFGSYSKIEAFNFQANSHYNYHCAITFTLRIAVEPWLIVYRHLNHLPPSDIFVNFNKISTMKVLGQFNWEENRIPLSIYTASLNKKKWIQALPTLEQS